MKVEEDERKKLRGQSKEKGERKERGDKKEKEQKKLVKAIIFVGMKRTIFNTSHCYVSNITAISTGYYKHLQTSLIP